MTLPGWLARLLARWRASDRVVAACGPAAPLREIDIDLTGGETPTTGESTDYDVHSLGEPIEPPAVRRAGS